jgi:soluble calcium-activated nucleotidase 1
MIHESCQWSSIRQRYFFLPRKVSFEKYDSFKDDYRAGNYLITANEAFQEFNVVRIGGIFNPAHGYSAFQFVPGTNDTVIIALKTEELEGQPLASYYTIFNIDGSTIYVDETKIPGDYKLEGLEFVDWSKAF